MSYVSPSILCWQHLLAILAILGMKIVGWDFFVDNPGGFEPVLPHQVWESGVIWFAPKSPFSSFWIGHMFQCVKFDVPTAVPFGVVQNVEVSFSAIFCGPFNGEMSIILPRKKINSVKKRQLSRSIRSCPWCSIRRPPWRCRRTWIACDGRCGAQHVFGAANGVGSAIGACGDTFLGWHVHDISEVIIHDIAGTCLNEALRKEVIRNPPSKLGQAEKSSLLNDHRWS